MEHTAGLVKHHTTATAHWSYVAAQQFLTGENVRTLSNCQHAFPLVNA